MKCLIFTAVVMLAFCTLPQSQSMAQECASCGKASVVSSEKSSGLLRGLFKGRKEAREARQSRWLARTLRARRQGRVSARKASHGMHGMHSGSGVDALGTAPAPI